MNKAYLNDLTKMANDALILRIRAANIMMGRLVVLKVGRYVGRTGKITNVGLRSQHGIDYCVMVFRKDGKTFLNSDADSRSYRPLDHFTVVS